MNVNFISFGCKVSLYETECMKEIFSAEGFDICTDEENSDVFVINSCTVTAVSDKKVRKTLHRIRKTYPDSVIVVTGCFPQAFPERTGEISDADIIMGIKNKHQLPELVRKTIADKNIHITDIQPFKNHESMEFSGCSSFTDKTRGFLKIQDGCNQFCSYCIIPYARGRNRSKSPEEIKCETEKLVANGHKEIVLVGINLAFYGEEFGLSLADAVEICCNVSGVERVRLGSLEPEKISDDDLIRLLKLKQFCPQFHLSLQSGCDRTLKAMNRKYNSAEYADLAQRIRNIFPECSLTTDIMVGFPDETDEDFNKSLEFVEKIRFAQIHVFPYSRRSGTPAASRPNQISDNIKQQRALLMTETGRKLHEEFLKSQVGKIYPVLFERENSHEFHQGYTPNYTYVRVPCVNSDASLRKKIFNVEITGYDNDCCKGRIVD